MSKINICGNFFGNSGYSRHTRSIANALNDLGHDVRIDTPKHQQWEREVNDFELQALNKPFDPEATTIFISQPPYWPMLLSEKPAKFIGYLVWEGHKIPDYWMEYLLDKRVDMIFVPSTHTYNAVINTIETHFYNHNINSEASKSIVRKELNTLKSKIHVISEGYDPAKFYSEDKPHDKFTFIANKGWAKGWNDRGGISYLLKAFCEEFKKDELVELKIKLNTSYNPPGWNLSKEMELLKLPDPKDRPKIFTCVNNLDDNSLRNFYNEGDVFVTTSMAEGFNLPAIEAMGCGLPVCTTSFGGQTDFVNRDNGWIINGGDLEHISDEIIYEEVKWLKPDIKKIRKMLRHIFNNQKEVEEKRIKVLEDSKEFTWMESAKKIINRL